MTIDDNAGLRLPSLKQHEGDKHLSLGHGINNFLRKELRKVSEKFLID